MNLYLKLGLVIFCGFYFNLKAQIPITDRQWLNYQLFNHPGFTLTDFNNRGFLFSDLNNTESDKKSWQIQPLANANGGNQNYDVGLGASVAYTSKKLEVFFAPLVGFTSLSYLDHQQAQRTKNVPGWGFSSHQNGTNYLYSTAPFGIKYNPSKFFSFIAGNGKHFLGPGKSSILLSDASRAHPYAAIQTKVWKLRYTNLFSGYNQQDGTTAFWVNPQKFSAKHYLEFSPNKKITIGLFETVIFKARDTLINRGFDVNYLNPVIFYRPVEYSTGSSDNVLIGLNIAYSPIDNFQIYSQFLIDEFLVEFMRADIRQFLNRPPSSTPTGWWANKHAGQLGFKWQTPFNLKGILFQSEVNYARPFTYTHLNSKENYGNNNQPLAHHLGANFWETSHMLTYVKNRWMFELKMVYFQQGLDATQDVNFGSDIFKSYQTRQSEFGNTMLQGYLTTYQQYAFSAHYFIIPKINLKANFSYAFINQNFIAKQYIQHLFNVGISTRFFNQYKQI